jgi:hypothetical protein
MARANPAQTSFAGGELSPMLEGRQDIAKYGIGCRLLRNFNPLIQGPARKRGGTQLIAATTDDSLRVWLWPFVFSETDAVVQSFGQNFVRFYTNRARIEDPPGTAYEIVSQWEVQQLLNADGGFALSIAQSADVQYIASTRKPVKLSRFSNIDWQFSDYAPTDGPFDQQNIDKSLSVTIDATTGTIAITNAAADVPVPDGTDDGRLIRIEETDKSAVPPWEGDKRIAAVGANPIGLFRRSDGHLYECATSEVASGHEIRTGTVKPIHTEGTYADGDGNAITSDTTTFASRAGVDWTYLHSGYGIATITACDGTTATATVTLDFPASIVTPGSYRWSLGAWYTGKYPTAVAFYRDRLVWAGAGQQVQATVAGDYESMAPDDFGEVLADSAINVTISIGPLDSVNWLSPGSDGLLISTGGCELMFGEITRNQVLGPANVKFELQGGNGSRKIAPVVVGDYTLYVLAGGRSIMEAQFDSSKGKVASIDITVFSEHLCGPGFVAMAYAKNPDSLIWCLRADGLLACLTYNPDEETRAWSLHDVGGFVESIACIPSPTAGIDDLYLSVKRDLNCQTVRLIEVMLPPHQAPADPWLACYQDSSLTYDGAVASILHPGGDAVTVGATGVNFNADTAATFSSGDVGRYLVYRYTVTLEDGSIHWRTAKALVTAYVDDQNVTCTIIYAWPLPTIRIDEEGCVWSEFPRSVPAGDWRMTATTISGLDHLEGEDVRVTYDGQDMPDLLTVNAGAVTVTAGCVVHVGLPMRGTVQLMNIEAGAEDGTAQGKLKKISAVTFRLFETLGGSFGPTGLTADQEDIAYPDTADLTELYSGDVSVLWNHGYETEGRVTFVHDCGLPATLCAVYPQLETHDQRTGGRS